MNEYAATVARKRKRHRKPKGVWLFDTSFEAEFYDAGPPYKSRRVIEMNGYALSPSKAKALRNWLDRALRWRLK